jgi:hypothetical protein
MMVWFFLSGLLAWRRCAAAAAAATTGLNVQATLLYSHGKKRSGNKVKRREFKNQA